MFLNYKQMQLTVRDMVIQFLKHLKIGQNAFEAKVGWSNGYISNTKKRIIDLINAKK